MTFNSKNLNRGNSRFPIGEIPVSDSYSVDYFKRFGEITKKAKKLGVDEKNIKNYVDERYEDSESVKVIKFYYEKPESDVEFEKRKKEYRRKDLEGIVKLISEFDQLAGDKEWIKGFSFEELKFLADWQQEQFVRFLDDKTYEEAYRDGLKKGWADGEKQLQDFKKKLKTVGLD